MVTLNKSKVLREFQSFLLNFNDINFEYYTVISLSYPSNFHGI